MKIIGIHQPNYLPWMGYFYKIYKSDVFVILDNVDFQSGNADSVTHRCKVKGPDGPVRLTLPVKHGLSSRLICDQYIDNTKPWTRKHMATLKNYYAKAPFFYQYLGVLEETWNFKPEKLSDLNTSFIKLICQILEIKTELVLASSLTNISGAKSELIVNICKSLQADTYLSGNGAKKYNDLALFQENGINLTYTTFQLKEYPQQYSDFVPGLSILDALFNVGTDLKSLWP